jgi:8-oxo-dGTP diphosphatase
MEKRLKVGSYGVCVRDGSVLLARYVPPDGASAYWTLPGGKIEHGEDPLDTVVREVAEETGYDIEVRRLLGVGSRTHEVDWGISGGALLHTIGFFYEVGVTGGTLRPEADGSTDLAQWMPLADVAGAGRAVIVDIGLDLQRRQPPDGRSTPVTVEGLLRH